MPNSDMPQPFAVETERLGDQVVFTLRGELDLATGARCLDAFDAVIAGAPAVVIVDLRHLAFMDSSGLQSLIAARARAMEAGVRLAVLNGPGEPNRLLTLTGMDQTLEMIDDPSALDPPPGGAG